MWKIYVYSISLCVLCHQGTSLATISKNAVLENSSMQNTKLSRTGADMTAWANGFTNCPKEMQPTVLDMKLPSDFPVGTYYRNGHGRFEADDGTPVIHPFDGDGMVVAMTFDPINNRVLFRNKFVETGRIILEISVRPIHPMRLTYIFGIYLYQQSHTYKIRKQEPCLLEVCLEHVSLVVSGVTYCARITNTLEIPTYYILVIPYMLFGKEESHMY